MSRLAKEAIGAVFFLLVGALTTAAILTYTNNDDSYRTKDYQNYQDTIYSTDTVFITEDDPRPSQTVPIQREILRGVPISPTQITFPDSISVGVRVDSVRTYYQEYDLYNGAELMVRSEVVGWMTDQEIGFTRIPTIIKKPKFGLYAGVIGGNNLYGSVQLKYKRNLVGLGVSPAGQLQLSYHFLLFGD